MDALAPLPQPPWKIAVVGAGAVGCYYGGRLAQGGNEVHFLLRRDLDHVRQHGLDIRSHLGDFHLQPVHAHGSTREIGPCDVVLIALKTTGNAALETLLPPLLGDRTLLVTLQNGLGNEEFLAARWGAGRVLGGVCFTCINRTAPGLIEHTAQGTVALGEFQRPVLQRTETLAAEFRRCGIDCRTEPLDWTRWKKLVWNVPFNGLAIAAGGMNTAEILGSPALAHLVTALMEEIIAIAAVLGHDLPESLAADMLASTRGMGPYRPSSMIDYLEGREVEVEALWGEPWRRALAAGAPAGRLDMLYHFISHAVACRKNARAD
ncbi:MAG: 2-dehydropantoate 2-reductase [Verrucomicrobiales bacterium]|nr:2-dehydropantoate 2-reductase [Verrucomicrobiales bacterium]